MALALNSGLNPIQHVSQVKSRQLADNNPRMGVDCMQTGNAGWYPTRDVLSVQGCSLLNCMCMPCIHAANVFTCTNSHLYTCLTVCSVVSLAK